jgi:glucuronoarabinoxylan endo-1,4-beta-xylanase
MKKFLVKQTIIAVIIAIMVLSLAVCSAGNEPPPTPGKKAEAPFIKVQPGDYQPSLNEPVELVVSAEITDGGALSWQWYKATSAGATGTKIEDATTDKYSPPTNVAGTTYYYVEISNSNTETKTTTKSRYATVFVIDPASLETPVRNRFYVVLDTSESAKHQFVRGFGGMINAWGAPCPDVTTQDADMLFNPDKLGLNILRMIIYPEPLEDIMNGLVYTSVDNSDLFDIGKVVNKYGGIIIGCPWTPPDGYKLDNGHLNPEHYMDMGRHLVTWVQKMEAGMGGNNKIFAISSQNEPDNNSTWCIYTKEENRDFVKQVFPWVKQQIPHVMLFPGEWTDFNEENYMPIVNDPAALAAVDGFAGHFYGGSVAQRKSQLIATGKEIWMTEHLRNTNSNKVYDPTWAAVWNFADDFHNCMINDYNAYVYWYAKRFYGLIGDSEAGVTNQRDGQPQLRGLLMSHYSKYAAGKYRYNANWVKNDWTTPESEPDNVRATVYMDEETITMVLTNKSTTSGQNGNMWVHARLPVAVKSGFAIVTYNSTGPDQTLSATAPNMVKQQPIILQFSDDKKTASVKMPASSFVSIRFYK